jgi:hypothetical protein
MMLYRDAYLFNSENCTGDNLKNCKNTHESFNASNCEDSRYLYDVLDAKDCQDLNYSLYKPELAYELISTLHMTHSAFCMASHYCHETFYAEMCNHSSNLFGCIGLKHQQYCILNQQYTKEEYQVLKAKILEHMKKIGEWGEFFPAELSPWGYNETVVNEYFPLAKNEALEQGFTWYENPNQKPKKAQAYPIPDHIRDVPGSIVQETLACIACGKNFKIIIQELSMYRKETIPIPRKCPDCRHLDRVKLRSPRKLFDRTCSFCQKSIRSTISNAPSLKVACEKCYLENIF